MTQHFAILAVGLIICALILLAIAHADIAWRLLRQSLGKGRSRWRIEEVRCNKCFNQQEPGVMRYQNFNPVTEELETTKVLCDRCEGAGKMKIVVIADQISPEQWAQVQREISEQVKDYEEIRTESEVSKANE